MTQLVRIDSLPAAACGGVVSIGNFDGVHRGHASLLGEVRRLASQLGGPSAAVVLDPHPVSLLRPGAAPERLTTLDRRAERLRQLGIDFLVVCNIDRDFLRMSADEFFQTLIAQRLQAIGVVEGENFFFGRDRGGDTAYLKKLCHAANIDVLIPTSVDSHGEIVSSTRIRDCLRRGDIVSANELLGAVYQIDGCVGSGARRGRELGFPTANLGDITTMIPGHGVYGGIAHVGQVRHQAAIHIGPNPTFENSEVRKVEVHLLDYSGDLYGQRLLVDFMVQVRDIARFDSPLELANQLALDINHIRESLASIALR